ncbi:MAG: phosphoribosylformylglycinamidine cyclo-ligase [Acidobacteriota bacterium]
MTETATVKSQYADTGVDQDATGLSALIAQLRPSFDNHPRARVAVDLGHYASVLEIPGLPVAIAIATDGVGTKILVAEMAGRHDTVGIDCVAMNANDLICIGADPISMVDYLAVETLDTQQLEAIGKGLAEGARRAEISIPGGELAQLKEMIKGVEPGSGYDLVGSCVGILESGKAIDGSRVAPGDRVVGVASTGLHSNGFSLARRVVFGDLGLSVDDEMPGCGRSVADELLEPTAMYVKEAKAMMTGPADVKAFVHVTGGGFLNLTRVAANGIGFHLDALPAPPPVFATIASGGNVSAAEMHEVFNMGVGFVVVVPEADVETVREAARAEGKESWDIGRIVADEEERVVIERGEGPHLESRDGHFVETDTLAGPFVR